MIMQRKRQIGLIQAMHHAVRVVHIRFMMILVINRESKCVLGRDLTSMLYGFPLSWR